MENMSMKSKITQELLLGVPPIGMYTVVKKDNNKRSRWYGQWIFDWNRSNSKILSYENITDANRRMQELKRKNPRSEYLVTRNYEECPNCRRIKPMKYMNWIGLCNSCMRVLYQEIHFLCPPRKKINFYHPYLNVLNIVK